jgi:hypothetical protein
MTDDISKRFVLPEQAVTLIHQLASDDDLVQLAIGDLSSELVDECRGVVLPGVVRRAIALEYGSGPETIRDRERVARLVTPVLRDAYPILRFHQWRAVCSVRDKARISELAAWAVEQGDVYGGRPASVLAIRRQIRDGGDSVPAWERRWLKALDIMQSVVDDESAPNVVRTLAHTVCEKAKHLAY